MSEFTIRQSFTFFSAFGGLFLSSEIAFIHLSLEFPPGQHRSCPNSLSGNHLPFSVPSVAYFLSSEIAFIRLSLEFPPGQHRSC